MVLTFKLKGLDCPNCAQKIETAIKKLDFVESATMNLMSQEIQIEVNPTVKDIRVKESLIEIAARFEPDVEVTGPEDIAQDAGGSETESPWRMRRLVSGGIFAVLCIALFYINCLPQAIVIGGLILSYIVLGGDVLIRAAKNICRGQIFDENFLMSAATAGALAIGEYPEAVAVMLFYQIGEMFQDRAVDKSRRNIQSLMDIRPDMARVSRGGKLYEISPDQVEIGEKVVVRPGERIPLDGVVASGDTMLDMRALTGESAPKHVKDGDEVLSGAVNSTQVFTISVTRRYAESTASKILALVQKAGSRKAKAEHFITMFARYYTPAVVIGAVCLTLIPVIFMGGAWQTWLNRSLVFLVISCPCALIISVPLTFFGGIGAASRSGILVKGGNYLEALNRLATIVFDKTGTLTKGNFEVSDIETAGGASEEEVLKAAYIAEKMSNHPIALSIVSHAKSKGIGGCDAETDGAAHEELSGRGVKCIIGNHVILAGNEKLMSDENIGYRACRLPGTHAYIAENGKYLGCIVISDAVKEDCKEAISDLRRRGIEKFVMLTGDAESVAKNVAQAVGIGEYHANMLPCDKVEMFEQLASQTEKDKKTAFVGDGVNDAPVLARADIGIAMGGVGSDAAIEAADIVFMDDDLAKLPLAIDIAKRTKQIVMQNIIFALAVKIAFLALGALGLIGMWAAVFADVGVMTLAVLNAMRMLKK